VILTSKNILMGLVGLGVVSYLSSRSFGSDFEEIPFRETAVDNMTERHRAIITAEMDYGGLPDLTRMDVVKLITGTPIQSEYNPGVTL